MRVKRRAAALTITRNEPVWLHVWCNYYCSSFPEEDVYVLDNSTSDGSVQLAKQLHPGINVIDAQYSTAFDHLWLKHTVENHQRSLLGDYDVVLFAETDEFLIPDFNKYADIYDYCCTFASSSVDHHSRRAEGWGVVHQIDIEPPVDLNSDQSLLEHRHAMWRLPDYDKTLITKVPLVYSKGFHTIFHYEGGPKWIDQPIDPDLKLLHAWHIDLDLYHHRHMARRKTGARGHHGSPDLDEVKTFFRTLKEPWNRDRLSPIYEGNSVALPEAWRPLLRF